MSVKPGIAGNDPEFAPYPFRIPAEMRNGPKFDADTETECGVAARTGLIGLVAKPNSARPVLTAGHGKMRPASKPASNAARIVSSDCRKAHQPGKC